MKDKLKKNRNLLTLILDILGIVIGYIIALIFLDTLELNIVLVLKGIAIYILVYQMYFNVLGLYQNMVEYEMGKDYIKYIVAAIFSIISITVISIVFKIEYISLKINVLAGIFISGILIIYRFLLKSVLNKDIVSIKRNHGASNNLLIIGAGISAREIIITILNNMRDKYNIVGLIDDDRSKFNHKLLGIKVIGTRYDIPRIVKEKDVDLIFVAINKIDPASRKEILNICQDANVKTRVLPTTEALIDRQGVLNSLRDVEIEDLLGREPIVLENKNIKNIIKNKVVLVTGGGGSIGSELCRQIIKYSPRKLIIFDIYENNLYDIQMELLSDYPKMNIDAIVGSVRDKNCLNNLFSKFHPDLVFHAAAHKHVPLMERSPLEAIKNNVFGTYNVANVASDYGVSKFVLISTDKAVNPTNIMGASKRLCEMIIQQKNKTSKTDYVAVRFGNVLGSNGSVIPLFKKQIAKGGPVTVTDKEITRFFMTIPEAVQLILQASSYAEGGEIFVLDMGKPVKIYDLAVSLIKLMGYEPNKDIMIEITGLRPGEKLYEEILMAEEGLTATKHNKIFISKPSDFSKEELEIGLRNLRKLEYNDKYSPRKVVEVMKSVVSTYKDSEEFNKKSRKDDNNE